MYGIFTVHFSRFLAEIHDFDQFSYAPVHDFSKNIMPLDRYLYIFSIFSCCSRFDHVLGHCSWYVGISWMFFRCFFFGFVRVSMILERSDTGYSKVFMRSPNVYGIFTVHLSRFLAEIPDFDQFS